MTTRATTPLPDFRAIFEGLPGLYMVFDRDFMIVAVSDAHLQATMTTRAQVIGRSVFDVFPENPADSASGSSASLRASLKRVLRNRTVDVMPVLKYDIRRPESEGGGYVARYWTPTNSPLLGHDGEVTYIINRVEDVTAYVQMQNDQRMQALAADELRAKNIAMEAEIFANSEAIARANHDLLLEIEHRRLAQQQVVLESERLAEANAALISMQQSRELLTGMIIHDLRNPLTAAVGFVDLLAHKTRDADESVRSYVKHLDVVNRAMIEMINSIIDVMRMEDEKMPVRTAPTDIYALIATKLEEYRGACARGGLTISYEGPARITFTTDGTLLGRVLDNLVVNAIKHTPRGGTVRITAMQDPDHLVLRVVDSGEGIAPADIDRLFQKYGRLEGQKLGRKYDTGLGLVFCRMAVELLHGSIRAESEPGKGSFFIIDLQERPVAPH